MKHYYSNGKLLLTAEYLVLHGATALAVPTRFGQSLTVTPGQDKKICWKSLDEKGAVWLEEEFELKQQEILPGDKNPSSEAATLANILTEAHQINPAVLSEGKGYSVLTELNFNRDWGLGSSSTLINNIAQWFQIDAYTLLKKTFGGSGYDIAAAQHNQPILYVREEPEPQVFPISYDPSFKEKLFFVHLNRKQNSRSSIEHFNQQPQQHLLEAVEKASLLSYRIHECETLEEFEMQLEIHETLISELINIPKVKGSLFPDYSRSIKSLGGWGGDFILATGGEAERAYFRNKGYYTILGYSEMVL